MCDYSLHNVATRPAKVGDKLVTTSFTNSCTRGFAAVGEPNVAVCLLPGTGGARKRCNATMPLRPLWPSLRSGNIEEGGPIPAGEYGAAQRASRCPGIPKGQILLVTRLCEGQLATVL